MPPFLLPAEPVQSIEHYRDLGGGAGLQRARQMGPELTEKEIRLARLRGRGGGGFPTATKWASVRRTPTAGRKYAVCNAAEGEPGTFKDRAIMRANPYQVIEGLAIAALAVGAPEVFVATKAAFEQERDRLTRAIQEMDAAGWLDGLTVALVAGPEEYLFGEEKAMLEVIEGHDPLPRLLPPFQHGLFATVAQLGWEAHSPEAGEPPAANPTLVNNCETLANVAHILARGAEWFRSMGTPESPGTIVCTASGDVTRAVVVEVEMGTPLSHLVERAGGARPGRHLKAAFSGVANAVVAANQFDTGLSYEEMAAVGSGLGSAGYVFYDDTACMVEVAAVLSRFLYVESCGQCPPCKRGTGQITEALEALQRGTGGDDSVEQIGRALRTVTDANRCYLPVEEQTLIASILQTFSGEVSDHVEGGCPRPRGLVPPKMVDLIDGRAIWDDRQPRKRPDWTYA